MQTSSRPKFRPKHKLLTLGSPLLLACALAAPAQTLAHPNWAGSGMTTTHWWRNAVFYRVVPSSFQDSDGDGTGDLRGLAQRTDYLQSLGVDAIILLPPFSDTGFDDLLAAASQRHIRLIIALRTQPGVNLVAAARQWLTRGAAGIELLASDASASSTTDALSSLHQLTRSYPGERVVLAGFDEPAPAAVRNTDLVDTTIYLTVAAANQTSTQPRSEPALSTLAAGLHQSLATIQTSASAAAPLFLTDPVTRSAADFAMSNDPARTAALNQTAALLMLASTPAAANLLYGQELGLQKPFDGAMQWTPSNLTPPETTEVHEPSTPQPQPNRAADPRVYGAFVPYVAPKPARHEDATFDPNALRGFSTKSDNIAKQRNDSNRDVAMEDHDPQSLLNFYKRLIQLHHDNPALRTGSLVVLNHSADNALVWLRVAPAATRTAPPVIIVCNLSNQTLYFSLADDLAPFHIRHLAIRNLLTSAPVTPIETTDRFSLPANSVYVGEVYR